MPLATPTKWAQLAPERYVAVRWPHPESFADPKHYNEMIWRDGTVSGKSKNGVMVRLDSGGSIEIRSLEALMIDQTDAEKPKTRRGGA